MKYAKAESDGSIVSQCFHF